MSTSLKHLAIKVYVPDDAYDLSAKYPFIFQLPNFATLFSLQVRVFPESYDECAKWCVPESLKDIYGTV